MWRLPGPAGEVVVKLAAADAVTREAAALERVVGLGAAPALLTAGGGVLVTEALAGEVLPAAGWDTARARALGALLARLHRALPAPAGTYDGWEHEEGDLGTYRARRARREVAPAPVPATTGAGPPGRFAWLHGDLWSGNIVWDGERPLLVDWEFSRPGEPAEDLAYLAAMDGLDRQAVEALIDGYAPSDAAGLAAAVAWWRPVLAAECAAWFEAEGDAARAASLRAHAGLTPPR